MEKNSIEQVILKNNQFLASMSHELRSPLNSILGFSEMLEKEMPGQLNEKQKQYVRNIHASGLYLFNLITDLMDIVKIDTGKIILEYSQVDLSGLVSTMNIFFKEQLFNHNLTLEIKLPENPDNIYMDERRIKQVLIILLSNSIKYTPAGGNIVLAVENLPGNNNSISKIKISVTDNGSGIKKEHLSELMKSWNQMDQKELNQISEETTSGLGLMLSKKIINLHNGDMEIFSESGKGTKIECILPVIKK